ncbi:MAG TPA: glycosyltransferase family 4 protein [Pyrinomonadaceae bacterium]|nr:glycosyltransferase family 4 protein [Pyrinomonadaceae bacterium]
MKAENRPESRVAMHLHPGSIHDDGERSIYGARVSVPTFIEALLRHGRPGHYQLYYTSDPLGGPQLARSYLERRAAEQTTARLTASDINVLKRDFRRFPFRVWHDADGDIETPIKLRDTYSQKLYPVTATSHVYSYQELLHDWILKLLLRDTRPCDCVICPGRGARTALLNVLGEVSARLGHFLGSDIKFKGRVEHIPYPIDTELFRPRDKTLVRRELGLPEDAFLIVWIGRVSSIDKADLLPLVRVFGELLRANPGHALKLVIAGSGPEPCVEALRRQTESLGIEDSVIMYTPLRPSRRHLMHAAADVFVSIADNVQEACGITPMEALASGVPQVVSDWDGYGETVRDGETGFVIPTYWVRDDVDICLGSGIYDDYDRLDHFALAQSLAVDFDALRLALQRLIDDERLRLLMAENSRRRASEEYAAARIIRLHEELWDELVETASRLPFEPGAARRYDTPAFVKMFSHYGTLVLEDSTTVTITEAGRRVADGEEPLPLYESFGVLSGALLHQLLRALVSAGGADSIAGLAGRVVEETSPPPEGARRHVLWLVKYGLARVGPLAPLKS